MAVYALVGETLNKRIPVLLCSLLPDTDSRHSRDIIFDPSVGVFIGYRSYDRGDDG